MTLPNQQASGGPCRQAHRPLRCAVAGAFVIIAQTSRSQDPSISASGSFSLRLLNRARLCICNRQRQVLSARPSQEQKQTLKASRHLEACVSAGRFGFALPRRPVFVFLLFSDLPPSLVACILFFFLPLRGVTQFRHLFFYQGESRHAAFFFSSPARLSVIAPLCLALLDHVCLCLSCLCRRRRQRESHHPPNDALPQTTPQAKIAAYCPTTTTCLVQNPRFLLILPFAYDFPLGSVLAVISCVSLQPVSSNPGDNHFLHALVGVFLRVLRPLSVLCDGWMLVRPLCVHELGNRRADKAIASSAVAPSADGIVCSCFCESLLSRHLLNPAPLSPVLHPGCTHNSSLIVLLPLLPLYSTALVNTVLSRSIANELI